MATVIMATVMLSYHGNSDVEAGDIRIDLIRTADVSSLSQNNDIVIIDPLCSDLGA